MQNDINSLKKIIENNKKNPDFIIIDVRESFEYKNKKIPNSKSLPLSQIESWFYQLKKNKKYIIYCKSGNRSEMVVSMMLKKGFKDVKNMDGGILAWNKMGFETI
ncbi:MAG: rhodanese-like domain-containing protein [Nanoarchaeota archaeon]